MFNSHAILIRRVLLALAGILLLLILKFAMFPAQPSQTKQLQNLEREANSEAALIMDDNQYTKQGGGSNCWDLAEKERGRSCSLAFQLHSSLPKSKITQAIVAHGWEKQTYSRGTKVENTEYTKNNAACSISDNDVSLSPNDGSLVRINPYYTFSCGNTSYDRSLSSLFRSDSD